MPVMQNMTFEEIFFGFLIALAAGSLIGLEREQSYSLDRKHSLGGVRTFPLIALSGALSALLAHTMGVWPILGALLVLGSFLATGHFHESTREMGPAITTKVAALITFLLGVLALIPGLPLATAQRYLLIVASAAVVMALLSFKAPLHRAVEKVSEDDLYATVKFVILILVVLPLLPNRTYDPLDVLNPFQIGLMIILIAAVSFLGYIAARILGEKRGLGITGLVGGLVSSTAVTVSLSNRVRTIPSTAPLAAVAILTASGTMFVRVLVIVGIVDAPLLPVIVLQLGAMALTVYGIALALFSRTVSETSSSEPIRYRNPLELTSALQFGILYVIIILVAKTAQMLLGDQGLYLTSVLAGTTDVDAISLSMAHFHREGLQPETAAIAITLATFTNTAVKAGITFWLGGWALAKKVFLGLGTAMGIGGVTLFFIR